MSDFERWVQNLIAERYGTAGAVAKAIGLTESGFSRGVRSGTLSVEHLLRLARETGATPTELLRLAGKVPCADVLDELYGESPVRQTTTPTEDRVIRLWRSLPKAFRDHWLALAEAHLKGNANGPTKKKP